MTPTQTYLYLRERPLNAQTVQQDKESRTAAKDEKILSDQDLFSWGVNLQNIL